MINKQIAITFEKIEQTQASGLGQEDRELPPVYRITKLRNAVRVEWNKGLVLTVGTRMDEKTADEIARCKTFDVTITD